MALTLTEGNKYSTTELQRAVIDRLVQDSVILTKLPFVSILGNSLTYNTVTTDAGAAFYQVGDTWVESTPVLTAATATLVVLGGDADIDNFLLKTRSDKEDLKGTVLDNKTKAVQYKFLDTFFYGDITTATYGDAKSFNGLHSLLTSTTYNTVHMGSSTTAAALTISKLRQAIDLITGRKPNGIFLTKMLRRGLSVYLDSIGDKFPSNRDQYGNFIESFDGIPIFTDDHIKNTESAIASDAYVNGAASVNTSLFILSFDEDAACGVHSGDGVQTEVVGNLETKDASRFRIKWYVSMMLQDLRSCAKVDGIIAASTPAA